jgi:hypothetical protein
VNRPYVVKNIGVFIHDRYWDHDHKDSQGVTKKIWSILPVLFNKSKSRFNWVNKEGLKRKAVD